MRISFQEKLRIIHEISDERVLRDEVLVPLFRQMGRYEVIPTHGPDEKGTDIVLLEEDPVDCWYTAVLVKARKISNAASGKDKELLGNLQVQLSMALKAGFECIKKQRRVPFNRVMIVTSRTISNSVRTELNNLAEGLRGQAVPIVFWEENDLVEKIDEYLPEFWEVRLGTVSSYLTAVRHVNTGLKFPTINGMEFPKITGWNSPPLSKRISPDHLPARLVESVAERRHESCP